MSVIPSIRKAFLLIVLLQSPEKPLQTNGVDCGVWSLAFVAALIRGYESVSISEDNIAKFRARLLNVLLTKTTQTPSSGDVAR